MEASVDQPTSEVAAVSNTNPETASTFRARFVGQGYKQVYTTGALEFDIAQITNLYTPII